MADPGFPVGGRGPVRGAWTSDVVLFGKNVCEMKELGPMGGVRRARPLDLPMTILSVRLYICNQNVYDALENHSSLIKNQRNRVFEEAS